ncbi:MULTISPECIES: CPBP family intramembrane glutamic endopeptidase [Pontibacillus]|uniref:Type II CAAX endopeptidase family protein n=1 Tax=Pontibacillus chungwhensis TaxID=265426 RepID=A0ABY8UXL8_9BACI|nr:MULTISPECIES: type II CAAX endopeptidase family protein [Pontibacillus]MCD5325945.1 CPBP family intramembrane metalloprotease [Pontibacillus sp. HN14]WIF98402.1 type II CAAX endopeptidase family protein [Pontibacillus chungwhensis]
MPRRYWYVILTYILVQLSGKPVGDFIISLDLANPQNWLIGWTIFSFVIGLLIITLILKPDIKNDLRQDYEMGIGSYIKWGLIGILLAFFSQYLATVIESLVFGVDPISENTQNLSAIAKAAPIFILIIAIVAPILEEIIFRKILFGTLRKYANFLISALVSGGIFGIVHGEPEHLLKYAAMGLVFAFLYEKTQRIIVPIITHATMNSLVIIAQMTVDMEQLEQNVQTILFGG